MLANFTEEKKCLGWAGTGSFLHAWSIDPHRLIRVRGSSRLSCCLRHLLQAVAGMMREAGARVFTHTFGTGSLLQ